MPFDASEFPRGPETVPSTRPPVGLRKMLAAWPRGLLRGDSGKRGAGPPSPELPGAEITAVHLLRAAHGLIEAEEAWGRGSYQTPGGRRCAIGALRAAAAAAQAGWRESGAKGEAHACLLAVAQERGFASVELMNDGSGHAEVLAAFDGALRRAARH